VIKRVKLRYFKLFEDQVFDLADHIVLAGPNNSGKTTLLQAVVVWNLALQQWKAKRGPESGSKAKQRTGVPLTRKDFTALPLREMNLLWTNTLTALRKEELEAGQKLGQPRVLAISVEGGSGQDTWECTFEFRYQNTELVHIKPSHFELPGAVREFSVVHIPPFSGIGAEETGHDRPYQDLLIGQGKAGDILRNLLLEVHQNSREPGWKALCGHVEQIFGYRLLPPEYEGKPFILSEYLRGIPKGKGKNGLAQLDIASAGSGFHQVLLLLAFFYARPSTVLLLDEPDAHLHVVLQKQIYDMLRRIAAERRCQLIIATHAEVLIDSTSPSQILSFLRKPHPLVTDVDRDQVREAIKRLTATDILAAEGATGILYVESQTDFDLLRAWANVLDHPLHDWFSRTPFWHSNQGRNPRESRGHFFALRAIRPDLKAVLLLDGDNRNLLEREVAADGLVVVRWKRYEAESYLIHPTALRRFIESRTSPLFAQPADDFLRDQLPPAVYRNPLDDHDYLSSTPASKTLLPTLFQKAQVSVGGSEYYLIAEQMKSDEIAAEVTEKLDAVVDAFGIT